ncbi:hypothetical protein [Rhizobium sp. Root651]|uniref:hypothetical protein n=1 Tax=Rhizobium sp. Root651 TaxID=1736577 RepID=UPI0009E967BC|nr:hypothetical protein [Rhizobium sp. Root651]
MTYPKYTESLIAPPLDHVPVTPTPRKYVRRGLKRAALAGASAAATIGVILVSPLVLAAVAVGGALWWLKCRLFAR